MIYVFPDTNVLLHFTHFRHLDWAGLVGDEHVTLVIAGIVLKELDERKYKPGVTQRMREKASAIGADLVSAFTGKAPVRPGVGLEVLTVEPELTIDMPAHGLHRESQDDLLVASALAYARTHPDRRVVLVTGDSIAFLKACSKAAVFEAKMLTEGRLPPEPDERELEMQRLRRENTRLVNRVPRLALGFDDGTSHTVIPIHPKSVSEEAIARRVAAERTKRTYKPRTSMFMATAMFSEPSEFDVARYKRKLAAYLEEFEKMTRQEAVRAAAKSLGGVLKLTLANTGSAVADDVEIEFGVDDPVRIGPTRKLPGKPSEPEPPALPTARMLGSLDPDLLRTVTKTSSLPEGLRGEFARLLRVPGEPEPRVRLLAGDGPTTCVVKIDDLTQGRTEPLPAVDFWFDAPEDVQNFTTRFRITSASLLEPIVAELHVRVTESAIDAG